MTLGAIFGGIHCSGWNFPFPTYVEQKLWCIASLSVTIIPIIILPFVIITLFIAEYLSPTLDPFTDLSMVSLVVCALVYVSARLVLLGLAFALLRHLPPTTFIAISWTEFYPHFFQSTLLDRSVLVSTKLFVLCVADVLHKFWNPTLYRFALNSGVR